MGWLKLGSRHPRPGTGHQVQPEDLKATTQHIETLSIHTESPRKYTPAPSSLPDSDLQFIRPDEVSERVSPLTGGLFIVVDDVVYDCTQFISEHPGGQQVIQSFAGAECSWQFWRFHGKKEMEEFGRQLRVGRTEGLQNQFKEPVKYVGLRRLGDDACD